MVPAHTLLHVSCPLICRLLLLLWDRYASSYLEVGCTVSCDTKLTHADPVVLGQTMSYATIIAALLNGEPFDEHIGTR
jgi:actin-related protein